MLLGLLSGLAFITLFLYTVGLPKEILAIVIAGVCTLSASLTPILLERRKPREKRLEVLVKNQFYWNPILSALFAYSLILLLQASFLIYNILVLDSVYSNDVIVSDDKRLLIGREVGALAILCATIGVIFISKFVSYRIKTNALLWLAGVVVVDRTTDIIIGIFGDWDYLNNAGWTFIRLEFTTAMFLFAAMVLGYIWARKTRKNYIMRRMFKLLPASDQTALIELVAMNPRKYSKRIRKGRT